jgi:hypothetical protein
MLTQVYVSLRRFRQDMKGVYLNKRMVYAWFSPGLRMVYAEFTHSLRKVYTWFTQSLRTIYI